MMNNKNNPKQEAAKVTVYEGNLLGPLFTLVENNMIAASLQLEEESDIERDRR